MNICISWVLTRCQALVRLALPYAALSIFLATPGNAVELQTVRGHIPSVVAKLFPTGRLPASQRVELAIGMPLRNKEALTNLLQALYDPASPSFHQYLTGQEFTDKFGPTEQDYEALIAFARANNLTVTAKHPNRVLLDVSGSVADIEKALHLTLRVYQHPTENRTFFAPDTEPSLDTSVPILHIGGLDNYVRAQPKSILKRPITEKGGVTKAGSGPSGTYMGRDFRAAYVPGTTLTGAGQKVGLFQADGFFLSDIHAYETNAGLPDVPITTVLIDGATGGVTDIGANGEVSLDIEMVISMAPGLSELIVYEGTILNYIPEDILNRMATDNAAKSLSCSWGWGGGPQAVIDQIFQQMIAQGQTFFDASGDSDAFPLVWLTTRRRGTRPRTIRISPRLGGRP